MLLKVSIQVYTQLQMTLVTGITGQDFVAHSLLQPLLSLQRFALKKAYDSIK
jgi:hypothetical protein